MVNLIRRDPLRRRERQYSYGRLCLWILCSCACMFSIFYLANPGPPTTTTTTTATTTAATSTKTKADNNVAVASQSVSAALSSFGTKQTSNDAIKGPSDLEWWTKPQFSIHDFPVLPARNDLLPLLEKLQLKRGIEVGVQRGRLAMLTLRRWKSCQEYVLVDLWGKEEGYVEPGADTQAQKDVNLKTARRVLAPWENITKFMIMRSTDAAKQLPKQHYDYIYIDARHDYCAVTEDLELYWENLRPGGIFAGHDFVTADDAVKALGPTEDWSMCEDKKDGQPPRREPRAVRGAVEDFAAKHRLDIVVTQESFPSWIIQKPFSSVSQQS